MSAPKKTLLSEGATDFIVLYSFLKRLTTPFDKWKAYELGIIDADGKVLKKRATLVEPEEKAAFTLFDILVLNIKKILERLPNGKSKLASFIAALYLIKEEKNKELCLNEDIAYESFMDFYDIVLSDPELKKQVEELMKKSIEEDSPANSVGAGGVAGLTISTGGAVIRKRKKFKSYFS